jgi:hypothetical protein
MKCDHIFKNTCTKKFGTGIFKSISIYTTLQIDDRGFAAHLIADKTNGVIHLD